MVSRSEAIHLTDAVALGEGAERPLQGRGQGEAKPPIARPGVLHFATLNVATSGSLV
jgi:hypothetical protein